MPENDTQTAERTRLISWADPMIGAKAARTMNGFDYLQAMAEGKLPPPPITALMNFEFVEVEKGRVVFAVEPAEYHYNPLGAVHGGLAATLTDSAMGCAIHTMVPAGLGYTTVELHVNYIRPITTETGRLHCIGEVIHVGRRMATAQARLLDENDKLYSHATTTCLIFQPNQP